jgi:hypothetical protein
MTRPKPQFRAHLVFTFAEHGEGRRRVFGFEESGHRRVPMRMDSVEGLNTVGMWIDGARQFHKGDETDVDCRVIWPEGFRKVVKPGVSFQLWDSGFFADGKVTEIFPDQWDN